MNFSKENVNSDFIPNMLKDLGKIFADDFKVKFNEARNKKADCNNWNDWSNEFVAKKTAQKMSNSTYSVVPAVNIHETENSFELAVIAPGLKKEDFKLSIEDNILKISSEIQDKQKENTTATTETAESMEENTRNKTNANFSRTEFVQTTFSRSFELPESVDTELISAKYEAGILYITLPKKVQIHETKVRKVEIA